MVTDSINVSKVHIGARTQGFLAKLHDQHWVKRFLACTNMEDRVSLLRSYNVQDQSEEAVIQLLVDKLDPPRPSVTFESQVRLEMEEAEKKGELVSNPQEEKYWEDRLLGAREMDTKAQERVLRGHFDQIKKVLPELSLSDYLPEAKALPVEAVTPPTPPGVAVPPSAPEQQETDVLLPPGYTDPNAPVTTLAGIAGASGERLNAAGIFTIAQFLRLTYSEVVAILKTPITASKYKEYLKKTAPINTI